MAETRKVKYICAAGGVPVFRNIPQWNTHIYHKHSSRLCMNCEKEKRDPAGQLFFFHCGVNSFICIECKNNEFSMCSTQNGPNDNRYNSQHCSCCFPHDFDNQHEHYLTSSYSQQVWKILLSGQPEGKPSSQRICGIGKPCCLK